MSPQYKTHSFATDKYDLSKYGLTQPANGNSMGIPDVGGMQNWGNGVDFTSASPAMNAGGGYDMSQFTDYGQTSPVAPNINFGGASPQGMWAGGWNGFTQQTNGDGSTYGGWGTAALGAASGLVNSYMGIKQFGLAKDSLKEGKRQFDLNYGAQKSMVNSRLEDRQRSRVADSGGKGDYDSTSDYMKKYGIQ